MRFYMKGNLYRSVFTVATIIENFSCGAALLAYSYILLLPFHVTQNQKLRMGTLDGLLGYALVLSWICGFVSFVSFVLLRCYFKTERLNSPKNWMLVSVIATFTITALCVLSVKGTLVGGR